MPILSRLKADYPQFSFKLGDSFLWSSTDNTIYYSNNPDNQSNLLLHELSHALLGHSSYDRDIQLIAMERQAWDYTTKLAFKYDLTMSDELVQSTLDSYRDWIHERSTCPKCSATGLQTDKRIYTCPACSHEWQVNQAKNCALRRYSANHNKKRTITDAFLV